MVIIAECNEFLQINATGRWFETHRCKDGDKYIHPIGRDMVLLRVEKVPKRAFYWIYKLDDATAFNKFVGLSFHGEAHEVITSDACRLFYDIDLALDEMDVDDLAEYYRFVISKVNQHHVMDEVTERIANVFKTATLVSLEEHGNDHKDELYGFDWMYTTRNRAQTTGYKISIHLITNVFISLRACAAIVKDVKQNTLSENTELLGITDDIASTLSESIDEHPYHIRGSLGLPFGTKTIDGEFHTSCIYKEFGMFGQSFFITIDDQFALNHINTNQYDIAEPTLRMDEANPVFVNAALKHVKNIKDYNTRIWNIDASVVKHSTMFVKRCAPSWCSLCERTHDNDNTMFLIFDSNRGIASWKCTRSSAKPIVFHDGDITANNLDGDDIDAFVKKHSKSANRSATLSAQHIMNDFNDVANNEADEDDEDDEDDISAFVGKFKKHTFKEISSSEICEDGEDDISTFISKSKKHTFKKINSSEIFEDDEDDIRSFISKFKKHTFKEIEDPMVQTSKRKSAFSRRKFVNTKALPIDDTDYSKCDLTDEIIDQEELEQDEPENIISKQSKPVHTYGIISNSPAPEEDSSESEDESDNKEESLEPTKDPRFNVVSTAPPPEESSSGSSDSE